MKIMIVDDHSRMREMMHTLFTEAGAEVREFGNGTEAMQAYDCFRPDWVFMDATMNELDGLAATRQLLSSYAEARVVVLSDESSTQLRRAARASGACCFLTKDFLLESLGQHRGAPATKLEPLWMTQTWNDL